MSGLIFYKEAIKMSEVKKPKTYKEQLEILKERGLNVSDDERAIDFLSNVNYYNLTGYLVDYKSNNGKYTEGIAFDEIYNIYQCDKRFKNILNYAIEIVEHSLKTKISYHFAHEFGAMEYMNPDIFKDEREHEIFVEKFELAVHQNKNIPFVKHHIEHYNSQFPIWVACELFTMGTIYNFYSNLPTETQKAVAKDFKTGPLQLSNWIYCVKYLRNLTAHYMRLYNFAIQVTPKKCRKNFDKSFEPSHKVFDIVYTLKFLILDKSEWNNYIIPTIKNIFDRYSDYINISSYGFPANWEKLLLKD
nr:MAG TPA: Abi-like protein [Caudoviricetes sp.]